MCVCTREGGSREESPGAAAASETLREAGAAGPHLHRAPPPLRGREQRGGAEARGRARGRAGSRRVQTPAAMEEVVGAPAPLRASRSLKSLRPRVPVGPEPGRCGLPTPGRKLPRLGAAVSPGATRHSLLSRGSLSLGTPASSLRRHRCFPKGGTLWG